MIFCSNDEWVEKIVKDRNFKFNKDGTISTRINKQGWPTDTWRAKGIYKHFTKGKPYYKCSYYGKMLSVHRIIYRKFKGNIDPNLTINHIDGDGLNNHIDNLELVTMAENNKHAYRVTGKKPSIRRDRLNEEKAAEIRELYKSGKSLRFISSEYGVAKSTISYVINMRTWAPNEKTSKDI